MSEQDGLDRHSNPSEENGIIQRYSEMRAQNRDSFFDVDEFEAIIDWFFSHYDTSEASRAIEKGLLQHPRSFDIRFRKAQLHLLRNEGSKGLAIVNSLELLEPSNVELHILKADLLSEMNHTQGAIDTYTYALRGCDAERGLDVKMNLGRQYVKIGNELDAIGCMVEVAENRPWDPYTLEELRSAYQRADLSDEGVRTFNKLTDLEPYSFQAWLQLGLLYNDLCKWHPSIDALDMALVLVPKDVTATLSKAEAQYQLDMYEEAIETYKEIEEPMELNAAIFCGIGECYEQLKEYEHALEYYEKALREESDYTDAFLGKAIVLDNLGQNEKALGNLRIALEHEPENYEFWHIYGEILSRDNQYDEAISALATSLKLEKGDVNVYKGYIDTKYDHGVYLEALEIVEEAFEHVGHDINIYIRAVALMARAKEQLETERMIDMFLTQHPGQGWQLIKYDEHYLSTLDWLVAYIEQEGN